MTQQITHWKKLNNPDYLGSYDFQPNEERLVTIKNVVQENVFNPTNQKKEICTVCHFQEDYKPMILNTTNCKMISELHNTPYIENWVNKKIVLHVQKIKAFGKLTDALRVKKEIPKEKTFTCEDCGNQITGFGNYTPEQIALAAKNKFGVFCCGTCGKKRNEVNKNES